MRSRIALRPKDAWGAQVNGRRFAISGRAFFVHTGPGRQLAAARTAGPSCKAGMSAAGYALMPRWIFSFFC
jgi:hypothetical protein